ncbi:helix-turn-helix transcriptional regulator [Nocardia sp. 348MFTsu5.1]|uniref:helix-turn-helix transcriptional regulator n=1 Tax=Nocardia sp. 348MFTsu5.1 TaxID=1172185 RepID=UPI0003821E52|nr:helix-turn-helix transcriptional regulator [Nocardia sp. 348MFTsu5.1]
MRLDLERRTQDKVIQVAGRGSDWMTLIADLTDVLCTAIPFTRTCWHTVDPGTVLFTGSVNKNIACSGSWLAEHEYVIDDVDRWWFLARSGKQVGAASVSTHGDLNRSARHRSREGYGTGDELRASFVADGTYWGAVGFLREEDDRWFTEDEMALLATLCPPIAVAIRRTILVDTLLPDPGADIGPGIVIFDAKGEPESISPAAERWIEQMIEIPPPATPGESKAVQAVAARARTLGPGEDPLGLVARSRVRTGDGRWLLLYGTPLSGGVSGRTAVVIQSARPTEVAPIVALAYGLTERERQVTWLCMQGRPTRAMAQALDVTTYTVQDHLKSIFAKTGVRSRGELVGQIFLEHYVPLWEQSPESPAGWLALHEDANSHDVAKPSPPEASRRK